MAIARRFVLMNAWRAKNHQDCLFTDGYLTSYSRVTAVYSSDLTYATEEMTARPLIRESWIKKVAAAADEPGLRQREIHNPLR